MANQSAPPLLAAVAGGSVTLWRQDDPTAPAATLRPHRGRVAAVRWSHTGKVLATAGHDDGILALSLATGQVLLSLPDGASMADLNPDSLRTLAFSRDSRFIASAGAGGVVRLWDLKRKALARSFNVHRDIVNSVSFSNDGTLLASAGHGGELVLNNLVTADATMKLCRSAEFVEFSKRRHDLLGSVDDDGHLSLWNAETGKLTVDFAEHKAQASGLSFSPANSLLVCSAGLDRRCVFYDAQQQKPVRHIMGSAPLTAVTFKDDGITVALGTSTGNVELYDLRMPEARMVTFAAGEGQPVDSLAYQSVSRSGSSSSSKTTSQAASSGRNHAPTSTSQREPTPMGQPEPKRVATHDDVQPVSGARRSAPAVEALRRAAPVSAATAATTSVFSPLPDQPAARSQGVDTLSARSGLPPRATQGASSSDFFSPLPTKSAYPPTAPAAAVNALRSATADVAKAHAPPPSTQPSSAPQAEPGLSTEAPRTRVVRGEPLAPRGEAPRSEAPRSETSRPMASHRAGDEASRTRPTGSTSLTPTVLPHTVRSANETSLSDHRASPAALEAMRGRPSFSPSPGTAAAGRSPLSDEKAREAGAAGLAESPFHMEHVRLAVQDVLEDFRSDMHSDVLNMHLELIRQFEIQRNELEDSFRALSVQEGVVSELERLREENRQLRMQLALSPGSAVPSPPSGER